MVEKKTVVVTMEYRISMPDEKTAYLLESLIKEHGTGLGSSSFSMWDWDPPDTVLEVKVTAAGDLKI